MPKLAKQEMWSTQLQNFLDRCFIKDASQRPNANNLLGHEWFQRPLATPNEIAEEVLKAKNVFMAFS
jgi:serine/threonine protein kinase